MLELKKFDYTGYDKYLYSGLQGIVMRRNHKILSSGIPLEANKSILEIGGAAKPHCSLVELQGVESYWVSDTRQTFENNPLPDNYGLKEHYYDDDPEFEGFKVSGLSFSRIIASHVWEHVDDPEVTLLKWVGLLSENGILDIAIPCDPGWAWRLGQLVGRKKATQIYGISSSDIDLLMAREHVNSCQNLIRIVKAYTGRGGKYFPFLVPVTDINLFVFFRLRRADFKM